MIKEFAVAKHWAVRVTDEFFAQARTTRTRPLLAPPTFPLSSLSLSQLTLK